MTLAEIVDPPPPIHLVHWHGSWMHLRDKRVVAINARGEVSALRPGAVFRPGFLDEGIKACLGVLDGRLRDQGFEALALLAATETAEPDGTSVAFAPHVIKLDPHIRTPFVSN
ncbi:hypothetical protein [Bradyrhizobium sp. 191]|uniref:hypothetical protein n=1 Tax=Bradyrhizobium sp. 191 TaxID=2782659 RepID=UPI001FFF2D78|nr:hypothetical protein [Bradyrhizobium sp. 191]UPJ65247.1 hypothetical protein IVB23_35880 [Bradyrhizobium sp. 191]